MVDHNQDNAPQFPYLNLTLFLLGLLLTSLALFAPWLGLDISPGFGILQMAQFLAGITFLTIAGYIFLYNLRPNEAPKSLQADIGLRLGATGLVFAYVTGLSDLIGIGTHRQPNFDLPYVGTLQMWGLAVSIFLIIIGMLFYHTSRGRRRQSAFSFLNPQNQEQPNP
ncbi:MAG TPA: hypothetical protein VLL52_08815 [Anaerolineae bacterium]|nr:hypothetical protein [Anaerolineae bacterium]